MSEVNTLRNRAKSAVLARDYTLAAKIYKSLILEEPDNSVYKMELGNLYVKAGKDDQALTIFNQIVKTDSENLDALIAISGIYRRQKKYEESVAVLEQALVTCNTDSKSRTKISYNLGFTYRQMGSYDDAIKCFEEVVEENPTDVLANNHLGAIYALQGNHTKAIEAYNRGLKYDINHPILQFNIAKSYAEIGEIIKAQSFFEGALRAKPGWTEAIEAYADLLLVENKVTEADEVVTQALKINPDDVKMHTAKGNVYTRQSIFDDAESEYKKALDTDENYKNALTGLANALENQGKNDEAIETISKAEKMNPSDTKIKKQSAYIHISANKLEEAYERIAELQKLNKNDVQTLNLLGQYYICNDESEKTEDCFASIKKINPDYNDVYRDWGKRFVQKGDGKKAEPYLQAAIQKNPNDSDAMVQLGELYERQNQLGMALQYYKRASSADAFNVLPKKASERIMGDDRKLMTIDFNAEANPIDYDSLFSGGKLDSENEENGISRDDTIESPEVAENDENSTDSSEDDSNAEIAGIGDKADGQNKVEDCEQIVPLTDGEETEVADEDFNFDQFGMDELANADSGVNDVGSIANLLSSDENAISEDSALDFDELVDDGAPIDEEDAGNMDYVPLPDGADYYNESSPVAEVETPAAIKHEISEDSLDKLEEQIKKAAELAEKANYAAESAWKAAAHAADSAQAIDSVPVQWKKPVAEESVPEEIPEESVTQEAIPEEVVVEEEKDSEEVECRKEEIVPTEEELNEEEELADSDLLAAEELLTEDDIAEAETEDDDFMDDIPDYLTEEEKESEENSVEEVENTENEAPKIDDLTLRRAIDMLPSIIAAIEDRSVIYRFRSFLSMFKTLREMLEYLPPEQHREFMTSRNRLLLDYVISKLSGKPGLYATTKALVRSGLIHENPGNKASEKEGIELVKEVLADLRKLSEGLEDDTLREVLNAEADSLEKTI